MPCDCNKGKGADAGKTTAELNAEANPYRVRASDGSEHSFADYDSARRWARKTAGEILTVR